MRIWTWVSERVCCAVHICNFLMCPRLFVHISVYFCYTVCENIGFSMDACEILSNGVCCLLKMCLNYEESYTASSKRITHSLSHTYPGRVKPCSALHTGFTQAPSPCLWSLNLYVSFTVILITSFSLSLHLFLQAIKRKKTILTGTIQTPGNIILFQTPERYRDVSKCWILTLKSQPRRPPCIK